MDFDAAVGKTFPWHELYTPNKEEALAFYKGLMGWDSSDMDMGPMGTYSMMHSHGVPSMGVFQTGGEGMENVPPHWALYIRVDDVDAAVAKAVELGGQLHVPAMDVPSVGRMAMLCDPHGATFWVYRGEQD